MKFDELFKDIQEIYTEAKEAPKGKHYTKRGALRSGDADADGDGGPKYRSDPTYKNPNEDGEFTLFPKGKPKSVAAILGAAERGEKIDRAGRAMGPDSREEVDKVDAAYDKGDIDKDDVRMIKRLRDEDSETAKNIGKGALKVAGKAAKGTAKLAGKSALAFADYMTDGDVSKGIDFVKTAYSGEDGEVSESLADHFMRFASKVSAAEQGRDVDIDELRIELNALDERLEALSSEESEETFDQLYDRYVTTNEEDAERVDKDRMKCNSPRRTSGGSKKFVVKACKDGKEKVVRFGDPNMKIKKSNPKRRKSFRARHKCDQKKDKFSAGYWACKSW
tara:strand:+ start:138 stop:1142 length:1005 start_codon:yes stop_codon:yes gene_type:complete